MKRFFFFCLEETFFQHGGFDSAGGLGFLGVSSSEIVRHVLGYNRSFNGYKYIFHAIYRQF